MKLNCFIQLLFLFYYVKSKKIKIVCFATDDFKFWLWCIWGQVMLQVMN